MFRWLELLPAGNGVLTQNLGDQFEGWDASTGFQFMPNGYLKFAMEFVIRHTNVPYFSGDGGVISPNGWNPSIGDPTGFKAGRVKDENRLIFYSIFRF